jgi:uncharacterized membrane protein
MRSGGSWLGLVALVGVQVAYPLVDGQNRAALVIVTVVLGFVVSVSHAALTRGPATAAALVVITAGGGWAVEALGVVTGFPFGGYAYGEALGPALLHVPLVIPLAWTWMAWPAWIAAGRLTSHRMARVLLAGVALAAWDLFLDPQMVAEGYWRWDPPATPALPGVPGIPLTNYLGWLVVAVAMMAILSAWVGRGRADADDRPMLALYLWTYASSVLAHAVFLGLPASAVWGGLGMGVVAIPLVVRLVRSP